MLLFLQEDPGIRDPPAFSYHRGKEKRTEGERPEFCIQRWEAVFRRERVPASIDRTFINKEF
jgi:hypothetical protein